MSKNPNKSGLFYITSSTDSQLKLWTTSKSNSVRTFNGHINEKNFVGLATDGDYVACGMYTHGVFYLNITN